MLKTRGQMTTYGVMEGAYVSISIQKARNLRYLRGQDTCNTYVEVLIGPDQSQVKTTKLCYDTLEPHWEDKFKMYLLFD